MRRRDGLRPREDLEGVLAWKQSAFMRWDSEGMFITNSGSQPRNCKNLNAAGIEGASSGGRGFPVPQCN